MKWSNLIVFLFLSEVTYAQKWELENIIAVKQMCLQVSAAEILQAAFNKNLDRGLKRLYAAIGGEKNYPSYIDIYCSCKARAISNTYSYESYMLDTHQTEKLFLTSKKNKECVTNAAANAEDLYNDVLQ